MQKVGSYEPPLIQCKRRVPLEGRLHLQCTSLEDLQQVAMPSKEALQDVSQLRCHGRGIERQDAFDNVIRTRFVCWIEIARLGRGLEWAHNDPRRIGAQMQRLSVEERGF